MRWDDEATLEKLRARDEWVFNQFVREHESQVIALAFRMLKDRGEAEDLAQEVFVTVFRTIDGFRGESKLSTWLHRITFNLSSNRLRYLKRRARGKTSDFEESAHASGDDPESAQIAKNTSDKLLEALSKLDDEQRHVFFLRDVESLSYEEIQSETGLALGTVKSRLHRARAALLEYFQEPKSESAKTKKGSED